MEQGKQRKIGLFMLFSVNIIWAGSFPAMAIAVSKMSPLFLTMVRLGVGALILAPLLRNVKSVRWNARDILLCFILGAVGFSAPVTLETAGLAASTPAMAAVAIAMEPLFTAIAAAILLHERISLRRITAFLVALAGAYIIAGFPRPGAPGYLIGDILLLLAVACYAIYNTFSVKLTEFIPPSAGAAVTLLTGFITCIPVWFISGAPFPAHLNTPAFLALLYLSLGATALAYLLWQLVLSRFEVSFAALFLYLQPVFGVILSMVIVGTNPPTYFYAGSFLILFAVFLSQKSGGLKSQSKVQANESL